MYKRIQTAITRCLWQAFEGAAGIYTEEPGQELQLPCFFVSLPEGRYQQEAGRRYLRSFPFTIHYFPASESEPRAEMMAVAERLFDALELLELPEEEAQPRRDLRGSQMSYQIADGRLLFFVHYRMHLFCGQAEVPKMETLRQNTSIGKKEREK